MVLPLKSIVCSNKISPSSKLKGHKSHIAQITGFYNQEMWPLKAPMVADDCFSWGIWIIKPFTHHLQVYWLQQLWSHMAVLQTYILSSAKMSEPLVACLFCAIWIRSKFLLCIYSSLTHTWACYEYGSQHTFTWPTSHCYSQTNSWNMGVLTIIIQ